MTAANTLQPGVRRTVTAEQRQKVDEVKARRAAELEKAGDAAKSATAGDSVGQILGKLPKSLMGPFTDGGSVIGVIVLALLLGLALRQVSPDLAATVGVLKTFMDAFIAILHWVVQLVPLIVMGVVAEEVAANGFSSFLSLIWLVVAVLLALALQFSYYMIRAKLGSWVRPREFHRDHAVHLRVPRHQCESPGILRQSGRAGRCEFQQQQQQRRHRALRGHGGAVRSPVVGFHLPLESQLVDVLCAMAASIGAAGISASPACWMAGIANERLNS